MQAAGCSREGQERGRGEGRGVGVDELEVTGTVEVRQPSNHEDRR